MKRFIKWLLILLAGLVVLVILAAVLLPLLFDPNDHKQRIEKLVTDSTGLSFSIDGEIGWSVFPWLGFEANTVTLGNAPGFDEPHLARIEQFGASLRLMPLLSRRVEIAEVLIDGMDLRAEIGAGGSGNWELLTAQGADTQADDGDSEDPLLNEITVAGVSISNSTIYYVDKAADTRLGLTNLTLDTGAIVTGNPIDIELQFDIESEALASPGEARLALSVTLEEQGAFSADVEALEVSAAVSEAVQTELKLVQGFRYSSSSTELDLPQIMITAGDMALSLNLAISGLDSEPTVDVSGEISEFEPKSLLSALAGAPLEFSDPAALSSLAGTFKGRIRGDTASFEDIRLQLDDTELNASLEFSSLAQLKGRLNGRINQLNLDRYQLQSDSSDASETSSEAAAVEIPGQVDGTLTIGRLVVAGAVAENIQMELKIRDGGFLIFPFNADLYGGDINGAVRYAPRSPGEKFVIKNNVKNLKSGPLLQDVAGSPLLDGLGTMVYELSIADPFAANPLQGLNGKLRFRFQDGAIYGINVMSMFRQAALLLKLDNSLQDSGRPETDFTSLVLEASLENGVLTTSELSLQAPYFRLSGSGSIDLAGDVLNYSVTPVLVDTPEGQGGGSLDKLKGVAIPVKFTGSLGAPEWKIDAGKLLLASQRDKLDGPAGDLLEALTDESSDGEKKDPGAALLNALMKEASRKSEKKDDEKDEDDPGQ